MTLKRGKSFTVEEDFALQFEYEAKKVDLNIEEIILNDPKLERNWGEKIYRLVFTYKGAGLSDRTDFVLNPL